MRREAKSERIWYRGEGLGKGEKPVNRESWFVDRKTNNEPRTTNHDQ
jgi:hypothetical protein